MLKSKIQTSTLSSYLLVLYLNQQSPRALLIAGNFVNLFRVNLIKDFLTKKPRETSGSDTSRKYQFQKDLSLYLLIDHHRSATDYVFLFDFHDDVLIIDSSTNPNKIDFYQIKSKDKSNWTVKLLTEIKSGKLSIMGKLYSNKLQFPNNTNSLNIVSNAKYSFKNLTDGRKSLDCTTISCEYLDDEDINEFVKKIKSEHSLSTDPELDKITNFNSTILSNDDSSTHCIGALSKLIHELNPENKINPQLAYNQILNEISRKIAFDSATSTFSDFESLTEAKGLSKKQFENLLIAAGLYKSPQDEWGELRTQLQANGVGYKDILLYKRAWADVTATLIGQRSNSHVSSLVKRVDTLIAEEIVKLANTSLSMVELGFQISNSIIDPVFDVHFIRCLIIKKLHEQQ